MPSNRLTIRCKQKTNKYPFLSGTPRVTLGIRKPYTHSIYDGDIPRKIVPNVTSFMDKKPRFVHEAFDEKKFLEILCRCGFENPCECPTEKEPIICECSSNVCTCNVGLQAICQATVPKVLYKGPTPRLSAATEGKVKPRHVPSPSFYNTNVFESTSFYHGCKWSRWTARRQMLSKNDNPGPAHYTIEREMTPEKKCYQLIREYKRKYAKLERSLFRFEQRPGPLDYTPKMPKYTEMTFYGSKAKRFLINNSITPGPGPAGNNVRRDFEPPEPPDKETNFIFTAPPAFNTKAPRFRYRIEKRPGPADYNTDVKLCKYLYCGTRNAPFNCSAKRFSETKFDYHDDDDFDAGNMSEEEDDERPKLPMPRECSEFTYTFKSRTMRFRPLEKKFNEPSPADVGPEQLYYEKKWTKRSPMLQARAPFLTSSGMKTTKIPPTPGPGYYNADKYKCCPAVAYGPVIRSNRFKPIQSDTPAPNEYNIGKGIELVLATHNQKLLKNIEKQHKFVWKVPETPVKLDPKKRELLLLDKAIADLSTTDFMRGSIDPIPTPPLSQPKQKMLRCFLYRKEIKNIV